MARADGERGCRDVREAQNLLQERRTIGQKGLTNSLGSTVVAMGERGAQALRNAERNGRGLCFQRDRQGSARFLADQPFVFDDKSLGEAAD